MKTIITGGCDFIGSNLAMTLSESDEVEIIDDLSIGYIRFVDIVKSKPTIHKIDLASECVNSLNEIFQGVDRIFHLAANADVRGGWQHPRRDINQNILATINVAEAARQSDLKEIVFASTGSVYGDPVEFPRPENEWFRKKSLYGMSKVCAEGTLSSYVAQGEFKVTIPRFVSVHGQKYHH